MIRFGLAVLFALGALTNSQASEAQAQARVQNPLPAVSTQPHVQFDVARFDTLTAKLLSEIFDQAAAKGLPPDKLINRALEGAARRASGTRIVLKVREHAAAMLEAREVLGAATSASELDMAASALRSGLDSKTLAMVRSARPTGSVETPIMVLNDIVNRGIPAVVAREAVFNIARMPRSDDALLGLQLTVAKNSVRGPGMALTALDRYVKGTVAGSAPPSTPATTDRKPIRPPPS